MASASEKKKEDWMNSKWRPMMGWMYMLVCMCDFIVFPVLWSLLQSLSHGTVTSQWQPLTLQGAGLFHIAMGAVLGIAAYGRTKEKLGGAENGGLSEGFGPGAGTTYVPPTGSTVNVSNQPPASFAAPVASTPTPAPAVNPTPAPAVDFGSVPPTFGDAPAAPTQEVVVNETVINNNDPDRPLRRVKK